MSSQRGSSGSSRDEDGKSAADHCKAGPGAKGAQTLWGTLEATRVPVLSTRLTLDVVTRSNYTCLVRVEWDDAKRVENLRKHGIDFIGVEKLFEGYTATVDDERFDYDEQRFVTFGVMGGRILAVAHTERAGTIRIISIRKATRREKESYFSAISE